MKIKEVCCAVLIVTMAVSPSYALAQDIYLGQVQTTTDADNAQTNYHYDGLATGTGSIGSADLANNGGSARSVYMPVTLPLVGGKTVTNTAPMGALSATVLGNGNVVIYDYAYDAKTNPYQAQSQQSVYQPSGQAYKLVSQTAYHRNNNGEMIFTQTTNWLNGQQQPVTTKNHVYDALGRLVNTANGSMATLYNYDINNNLLQKQIAGKTTLTVAINGIGEAVLVNAKPVTYDSRGNEQLNSTGNQYDFNARNQFVADQSNGKHYLYGYGANHVRWSRTQQGAATVLHYYNSGMQVLNAVSMDASTHQAQSVSHYLLANGRITRQVTGTQAVPVSYYLLGTKGTVAGHLDATGQLASTEQYSSYGTLLSQHVADHHRRSAPQQIFTAAALQVDPFGFNGEQKDSETQLIYMRSRYYDSVTGRFTSQDSYRLMNRYGFAGGDPVGRSDPGGHISKLWGAMFGTLAVGLGFGLLAAPLASLAWSFGAYMMGGPGMMSALFATAVQGGIGGSASLLAQVASLKLQGVKNDSVVSNNPFFPTKHTAVHLPTGTHALEIFGIGAATAILSSVVDYALGYASVAYTEGLYS